MLETATVTGAPQGAKCDMGGNNQYHLAVPAAWRVEAEGRTEFVHAYSCDAHLALAVDAVMFDAFPD